ncbi:type II toxin-antitoxin system Phd/YefM family antitoxin [Faecalicoccus acidiformans]|uniref:type II toxin-antitoxin system Phd/YefM family antitoxin n=1 Tax=Faecalicoccus acidiformans TaxID=915173 RepID=UPI00320A53A7
MFAINYSTLRENMKTYFDKVTNEYETMVVTRKNHENVIVLSEETYNNLMENLYLFSHKENADWLTESKNQLESANFKIHELIEEADE